MLDKTADVSQDITSRIARRVKALRTESGLTLDALAAQCNVSSSMISLIERGESSPTAVVLEKIASGLGVSLAALFEDAAPSANPVSHREDRLPWRDPQSGYIRCNISPANFPSPIQIVEVILPVGATVAYETGARNVNIHQQVWVQAVEQTLAARGTPAFESGLVSVLLKGDELGNGRFKQYVADSRARSVAWFSQLSASLSPQQREELRGKLSDLAADLDALSKR